MDDKHVGMNNKMQTIVEDSEIHDLRLENHSQNHLDEVVRMKLNSHPLVFFLDYVHRIVIANQTNDR